MIFYWCKTVLKKCLYWPTDSSFMLYKLFNRSSSTYAMRTQSILPLATGSKDFPGHCREGLNDLWRSHPTQTVLWFSTIKLVLVLRTWLLWSYTPTASPLHLQEYSDSLSSNFLIASNKNHEEVSLAIDTCIQSGALTFKHAYVHCIHEAEHVLPTFAFCTFGSITTLHPLPVLFSKGTEHPMAHAWGSNMSGCQLWRRTGQQRSSEIEQWMTVR